MAKSTKVSTVFDVTGIIPTQKENNTSSTQVTQNTPITQYTHDTQRKQKHPRINMAFYDNNLEYVREAAYQARMSVTEYVNKLIKEDQQRKTLEPEIFDGTVRPDGQFKGQISIDEIE